MKQEKAEKGFLTEKSKANKTDLKVSTKQDLSNLTQKMKNSIPQNVNSFLHLIGERSAVNGDGINWVLALRTPQPMKNTSKIPDAPFSTYGKSIICQQELSKPPRDFSISGVDKLHTTTHLYWHRNGPTVGCGQVGFEAGLRNYSLRNSELRQKEQKFRTVAFHDTKYEPYFLAPQKKGQKGVPQEKIKAWFNQIIFFIIVREGRVPYPKYDCKFFNVNHNEVKHLYKPQVEMGQINWELSLRGFKNHELRKDLKKGDFFFRKVGELGPKHQIQT